MVRVYASLLGALFCMTGCMVGPAGPTQHDYRVVERDSVKSLHASLTMGAGTLRVGTGTDKLARADFDYNVPSWKPEVRYSDGDLTIRQPPTHGPHFGNTRYEWDVRLARDVPLDLNIHFGAGEAHLDLGGLTLQRVNVEMGVGQVQMDLRGTPKQDYTVGIQGGVGEATVYLPSDVGIDADVSGGIGEIKASGLRHDGSHYFNDAYRNNPKVTVRMNIHGGVGSIHLVSD